MGVKEKANEAPGLAFLLGRSGSIEPSIRANVLKHPGQQRGTALAHIFDGHAVPQLVSGATMRRHRQVATPAQPGLALGEHSHRLWRVLHRRRGQHQFPRHCGAHSAAREG